MIYHELLTGGATVTAKGYVGLLQNLAAAIREKLRRMTDVHLLHDNAQPHVASSTRQYWKSLFGLGFSIQRIPRAKLPQTIIYSGP